MQSVKKDINFFKLVSRDTSIKRSITGRINPVLVCVVTVILVLLSWIIFLSLKTGAERRISSIISSMGTNPPAAGAEDGSDKVSDIILAQRVYYSSSLISTAALKAIYNAQPEDLTVLNVVCSYDTIVLDCMSRRELCGADFARSLREVNQLSDVEYSGVYVSGGEYHFTITAIFAGGEEYSDAR